MIMHTALYKKLVPKLPVTIPTQSDSLTYTGGAQSPSWDGYYNNLMTISGQTSGTNAGNYTVTFKLKDKEQYQWENGTVTDKKVTWTIERAIAQKPNIDTQYYPTYNGYEQSILPYVEYDNTQCYVSSGDSSGVNAGQYFLGFHTTENYLFLASDNSTYESLSISWVIYKASPNLTVNPTSITLDSTNTTKTITVNRSGDGAITATSSNTSIATVSVSGNTVTVSSVNNTKGTATITIYVDESTNYESGNTNVSVTASFIGQLVWNKTNAPSSITGFTRMSYGNNKFFVGSSGSDGLGSNKLIYSSDGINWGSTNLPSSKMWYTTAYGNGKYVIIGRNSSFAAYSTDCINWSSSTLPSSSNWNGITYGDDKFVAVAVNSSKGAYSIDGINWSNFSLPFSGSWYDVCYGDGKFVAISANSGKAAYSENGINWTETSLPVSIRNFFVCYGNGMFISSANSDPDTDSKLTNKYIYSLNGINWFVGELPISGYWAEVSYGNGCFVILDCGLGFDSSNTGHNKCAYSEDGFNWQISNFPSVTNSFSSISYGNNKFVAVGAKSGPIVYSNDL